MKTLFHVGSEPVVLRADGSVSFVGELTIDADGARNCYGPAGTKPLDFLANAGRPGNWWGIATDNEEPDGEPLVQGASDPFPGYFVATTSYKVPGFRNGDPRRELDSAKVAFIVVPRRLIDAVPGIVMGCKARVTDTRTKRSVDGLVGDSGPNNHLGEASMAMATGLGIPSHPKRGGSADRRFLYELWPGVAAEGFVLQAKFSKARLAVLDAVGAACYA
jgi:hypothetical protein